MSSIGQTRAAAGSVIGSGPVLLSGGLPAPHAFSTREGGVSSPPFDSLNFGNPGELPPGVARDPKANIEENFRRVLEAIGCAGRRIVQVHQVHGAAVHVETKSPLADARGSQGGIIWGDVKADAIVTDDPSCIIAVRVADCCPVLLASADGVVVGAVHAGWRGVVAGVAAAAVRAMEELGARGISAAIGPCISAEHFEVGPEVASEFRGVFGDDAPIASQTPAGKAFIDLQAGLERQLRAAGVEAVHTQRRCTFAEQAAFFSHRRDRGVTGRMVGLIGPG